MYHKGLFWWSVDDGTKDTTRDRFGCVFLRHFRVLPRTEANPWYPSRTIKSIPINLPRSTRIDGSIRLVVVSLLSIHASSGLQRALLLSWSSFKLDKLASKFLWNRRILEDKLLSVIGRFLWLKAFESICGFKNRSVVRSKHSWSLYLQGRIEYVVGLRWDILIENRQRGRMSLLWLLWSAKHPIHASSLGDCLSTILPV